MHLETNETNENFEQKLDGLNIIISGTKRIIRGAGIFKRHGGRVSSRDFAGAEINICDSSTQSPAPRTQSFP